jgi:hypothetical protein
LFYHFFGIHFLRNFQYLKAISKFKEAQTRLTKNDIDYYYQQFYLSICLIFCEKVKEAKKLIQDTDELLKEMKFEDKTLYR